MKAHMTHEELIAKAREVDDLFHALTDDVIGVAEIWQQRGDELSHRLYVRTVFAFVEGIIQVMKSSALVYDEINDPHLLTPEEITLLREEEVQIGNSGQVEIKKKKIPLLPNFEFAVITYAKVKRREVALDKSGEGWQRFQSAVKIRNKLTHPHAKQDLRVTDEEMAIVEMAMKFFRDTTGQLLHG
jgi:putative transposon-encoded protein